MLSTCGRIIRHAVLAVAHVIPYASPVLASIPFDNSESRKGGRK